MQCRYSGCSKSWSANIVHNENILKAKFQGNRERDVINLNTWWICTAQSFWRWPSFPSLAYPFSILTLNFLQTANFIVAQLILSPPSIHELSGAGIPERICWRCLSSVWFGSLFACFKAKNERFRWLNYFSLKAWVVSGCLLKKQRSRRSTKKL